MNITPTLKKYVMPNLPYLLFLWFFAKLAEAYRIAPGADIGVKLLGSMETLGAVMASPFSGFTAQDLLIGLVKRHPVVFGAIGLILFVVFFFSTLFTSCSNMATGGIGAVFASSYLAEDADIDNAELVYTEWETDLQMEIANAESTHPGYDEYRYNVDDIGHNPYELMGYLTAAFQDFTYSDARAVLQQIFNEQYQLSFVEEIEIRYRTDPETGESYDVEVPYEWYILNVNLTARSFTDVIAPRLTSDEWEIYYLLMQTKGNRQYLISPFDFNWLPYVTSYYGWRVHPISGEKNYHKGVDIGVPTGTEIVAGHDGIVTAAAYDAGGYGYYVVLDGEKGLQSKYAHCDTLLESSTFYRTPTNSNRRKINPMM